MMKIKRKIVARAVQRLIGLLTFDELTAIYKAEQNAKHACAHLGMSAQIATQDTVLTVAREIVEGLSDYQIDQMGHELNAYGEGRKSMLVDLDSAKLDLAQIMMSGSQTPIADKQAFAEFCSISAGFLEDLYSLSCDGDGCQCRQAAN